MAEAEGFAERILACIESIPPGRVMTYGDVAEFVGTRSARVVGRVLAQDHGTVPWHRVLRAERHIGRRARGGRLMRDYQRTTGRTASSGCSVVALIAGS